MHATVVNNKSYTLVGALGPEQNPRHNAPVPTGSQGDEIGDMTPLPSPTDFVDTSYGVVGYSSSSSANGTCTRAPRMNASFFESSEGVNGVGHTPSHNVLVGSTLYVGDSIAVGVAWRPSPGGCIAPAQNLAEEVDSEYKVNPDAPSQHPTNLYAWCPRMPCLHLSADGTPCLQVITCATVSEHFTSHGVRWKSRTEDILCRWEECFQSQKRHNFVRHVREAHLGHRRGTAVHNSRGDGGRVAFPIVDVNTSKDDRLDLPLADCL